MQEREQPTLVAVGSQSARLIGHLAADDLRSQPVGKRPSFEMQPGVLEAFARQTHDSRLGFLKLLDDGFEPLDAFFDAARDEHIALTHR